MRCGPLGLLSQGPLQAAASPEGWAGMRQVALGSLVGLTDTALAGFPGLGLLLNFHGPHLSHL